MSFNSGRKALLEKSDKQRKIEEANKANKSLSSRMSSEYFQSVGGKSVGKQFTLGTNQENPGVRNLSANEIIQTSYIPK